MAFPASFPGFSLFSGFPRRSARKGASDSRHPGHFPGLSVRGRGHVWLSRLTAIALAVLLPVGLTGCSAGTAASGTRRSSSSSSSDARSGDAHFPTVAVMLDWTANTNHVGVFVAQSRRFYRLAGVNVQILPTSTTGAERAVETGVADIGFTTLSNVAAADARGSHLKMVFDLTQKPVARWCALASRKDIRSPKDFSGKTFVSFGSAEQTAVVRQMIAHDGGKPTFSTATSGTSTYDTLAAGKGDFAGFYDTWEGVRSRLSGPKLRCYEAGNYGVPGNPDQIGLAVNSSWARTHKETLSRFVTATQKGYRWALTHPDKAAKILAEQNKGAGISEKLATASMRRIVSKKYWGSEQQIGRTDFTAAQEYLDFLAKAGVYSKKNGGDGKTPQARQLATDQYLEKA